MFDVPIHVIGLLGAPGAGKDTCAAALERHGYVERVAFADALRVEVAQAFRVDVRMLKDRATKEVPLPMFDIGMCDEPEFLHWAMRAGHALLQPRSARWIMQRWGSDFRRGQDEDYWVNQVKRWIGLRVGLGHTRFVVTDVRMANEAALVRRMGGQLVQVWRPGAGSDMAPDTARHSSERHTELKVHAVIDNRGTLADLDATVAQTVCDLAGMRAGEATP